MDHSDHLPFPRNPRLRPGLAVLRRDDGRWQLGLDPADRLVLPDAPDVDTLVRALRQQRRPALGSPGVRRWAQELLGRGLVVCADDLARASAGDLPREAVLAAFHLPGGGARLAARARARVLVRCPDALLDQTHRLLDLAGLTPARTGRQQHVALVVVPRCAARENIDPLVQAGIPHLLVRHQPGSVEVGPFVAPGLTACLRCLDEHESDRDPGAARPGGQGTAPDDVADPLLTQLALSWAARDLVAYVEGDEPSTWSASVRLDAALAAPRTVWTRHPRCGCAWGDALATG